VTRARVAAGAAIVVLAMAVGAGVAWYRWTEIADRQARETLERLRQQIVALDAERAQLRQHVDNLVGANRSLEGMPGMPVKVAVPILLMRRVVDHVFAQMTDSARVQLSGLRIRRTGTIRRGITLGDYDLQITVNRVGATLRPGRPRLAFAGNRINATIPVTLASGTGRATVEFVWNGRTVAGALCGDMTLVQTVTGAVTPRTYPVSGTLLLATTDRGLVVRPRLSRLRVHLDVVPAADSWAALQQVLDDKRGLCGFVIDRVDVLGAVKRVVDRGFDARIPTERLPSVAFPVRIEPTLVVRGAPVVVEIRIGELTITDRTIWLGANVALDVLAAADATSRR
jgi:hypothetical protein